MKWAEVLEDKSLQNLSYKIELNEWGQIVMSPASNKHGYFQSEIVFALKSQIKEGSVISECSIDTSKGVKVADVAWCSKEFIKINNLDTPFTKAPEICVEILSPSNSKKEIEEKIKLYFDQGAKEVWIVHENGEIHYYNSSKQIHQSSYNVNINLI